MEKEHNREGGMMVVIMGGMDVKRGKVNEE